MQGRSVSWPVLGDRATFRRRLTWHVSVGSIAITTMVALATIANPALLAPLLPLAASAVLLLLLWTHGSARSAARLREVEQSFAGLVVIHLGVAYHVDAEIPVLGEHATRRLAARAAIERGGWALIVQAWDRYYLLAARPARSLAGDGSAPVSFRSRAVADVVPAILDDVAVGA